MAKVKDNWQNNEVYSAADQNDIADAVNRAADIQFPYDSVMTLPRVLVGSNFVQIESGKLYLNYEIAKKDIAATTLRTTIGNTVAAGLTLARFCAYSVAQNGDLSLVASTPSDTALFNATYSSVSKALSSPYTFVRGNIYALGFLLVGSTMPNPAGWFVTESECNLPPRYTASLSGQSNLPASIPNSSLNGSYQRFYVRAT